MNVKNVPELTLSEKNDAMMQSWQMHVVTRIGSL